MNKYKFILFITLTTLFLQKGFTQLTKNDSILMISDSLVISLTGHDYFEALERDTVPYMQEWTKISDITDLTKTSSSNYKEKNTFITYSVHYKLKSNVNDKNLYVINEFGGLGPAGLYLEFNNKLELINSRRFSIESHIKNEYKAYQRYLNSTFITKEKAKLIAEKYFSKGMKPKYWTTLFIYDIRSDLFYWCIEKEKGFMKVTEESVYINAEDAEYIDKKTSNYRQSFWMALFGI